MKNLVNYLNNKILKNKKLWLVCVTFVFLFLYLPVNAYAAEGIGTGLYILVYQLLGIALSFISCIVFFVTMSRKNITLLIIMGILNLMVFLFNFNCFKSFAGDSVILDIIISFFKFMPLIILLMCFLYIITPNKINLLILIGISLLFILSYAFLNEESAFRKNLKKQNKNQVVLLTSQIEQYIKEGNLKKLDKKIKIQKNKQIAMFFAIKENKKDICEYLISNGVDINMPFISIEEASKIKEEKGEDMMWTYPLHYATSKGKKEFVELLVKNGANVNTKDFIDNTPIIYATRGNFLDITEFLINKGADVNIKVEQDLTALDWANNEEMKQLLISHGAKSGKDLK